MSIFTLQIKRLVFLALFTIYANHTYSQYYPDQQSWESRPPSEFGIDTELLQKAVDSIISYEYSGPEDLEQAILKGFEREPYHQILGPTKRRGGPAGLIIKDGYIISQWGDTKRVDMTFSVTKSYLSTIAGLAKQHGLIKTMDEPVNKTIWDGHFDGEHNSKIKWSHLLTQSSDWSGQLWGGYDWNDRPPREGSIDDWRFRELVEPGTVFEYNDVRVNLLAYSLLQVWRKPLPQVLKEEIMDPIGASPTWRWFGYENSWTTVDGLTMQSVSGGGHSGGGLFINTEDHARFGLLFSRNGKWNEEQLVAESWIDEATSPSPANASYGYMWWLNNQTGNDRMSNLSYTGFYAAGFGGNYIMVEPEQDLVVVMRWCEPSKANTALGLIKKAMSKN